MNKRVKWGIIIVIGAGLIGGGIYSQLPLVSTKKS
jgi:membrane fusion protein (multidrug efflux system)